MNNYDWITYLSEEDQKFIKNFVMKSGSLKEIAKIYSVSYPTVRLRLDKIIQSIDLNDEKEDEEFSVFIKKMAIDGKIGFEETKQILEKYKLLGGVKYD